VGEEVADGVGAGLFLLGKKSKNLALQGSQAVCETANPFEILTTNVLDTPCRQPYINRVIIVLSF
jgi:hypothetical protein